MKTILRKEAPIASEVLPYINKKFLKIAKRIEMYVYNTDEYKNMPQVNGGYE